MGESETQIGQLLEKLYPDETEFVDEDSLDRIVKNPGASVDQLFEATPGEAKLELVEVLKLLVDCALLIAKCIEIRRSLKQEGRELEAKKLAEEATAACGRPLALSAEDSLRVAQAAIDEPE